MNQLTLRQIPKPLENQLRILAKRSNSSLNKVIIYLLSRALGIRQDSGKKRNLSKIGGTWSKKESENFEKSINIFTAIDEEIWKK